MARPPQPSTPIRRPIPSSFSTPFTPDTPSRLRGRLPDDDDREKRSRKQSLMDDRRRGRASLLFSPAMSPAVGAGAGGQRMSAEEQQRSFDEWMKIAADNKINANNSWNLALIDYFYDMTLLRDGDSINFQKASCTLDGCVKIYTSRVDSVDSETKKLLSGLADSHARGKNNDDGEDASDGDGEGGEVTEKRPKRKSARSSNTLEKDASALNIKKFDLEFMVDPLFKKTSADFDEGGARGLLLNHLSISRDGKIIFDASDASDTVASLQEEAEEGAVLDAELVDISKLKLMFEPSLSQIWEQDVCPSLKSFEFSGGNSSFDFGKLAEFGGTAGGGATDFGTYDDDAGLGFDDGDDDDFGGDDAGLFGGDGGFGDGGEGGVGDFGFGDVGPGNPLPDKDFVMMMSNEEDNVFSYFDTAMLRSWAGPEHWRSRPVKKDTGKASPKKRAAKARPTVDFVGGEDVPLDVLFAPATGNTFLPKQAEKSLHLLPDDMHFSSKDLLKLFLKPQCKVGGSSLAVLKRVDVDFQWRRVQVKFRRKDGRSVDQSAQDEPADEVFWAEHENDGLDGNGNGGADLPAEPAMDDGYQDFDSDSDADEEDFSMDVGPTGQPLLGGDNGSLDYADQLVAQPLKVKTVPLNYARVAKKVDVKKLKENIWRKLTVEGEPEQNPFVDTQAASVGGVKTFTEVVKGMDGFYPEKKRKDISVAFCFICLLHLANEQGLKIEGEQNLNELRISQPGR
ncbi:hypothetical protein HK104_002576 [Borealophlyctis nickersoniae]|nr:hypothetical protein HK104_002576 [Borealophlyctis nickersoniae]